MSESTWWRGAVIYQIYPRSFLDTDGDGVGDLPGIIERLDYVAALGVDAIWISPFFKSPMADFGYDIADYRAVDPLFGTMADFDRLLEKAHALGLKVMITELDIGVLPTRYQGADINTVERMTPEQVAVMNPYNQVPVLVERDLVLHESNIINEYID